MQNVHSKTVESFGSEWATFTQSTDDLLDEDRQSIFDSYFHIFPWDKLPPNAIGIDVGCGSGRWAKLVAPKVGKLYVTDPSKEALSVARSNLAHCKNIEFLTCGADDLPNAERSLDFGYCLGVLHHVPDTQEALSSIIKRLKLGAPFLLYLYYNLDNRSHFYRLLWRVSDIARRIIFKKSETIRRLFSTLISAVIYFPAARMALGLENLGFTVDGLPLSFYRRKSFYVMRTDSYDRFCTPLEKRFSRLEIEQMMIKSGLQRIEFSSLAPYWVAIGYKSY